MTRDTDTQLQQMKILRDRLQRIRRSEHSVLESEAWLFNNFGMTIDRYGMSAFGVWSSLDDGEKSALGEMVSKISKMIVEREEHWTSVGLSRIREAREMRDGC
jgi:hypothetical protein